MALTRLGEPEPVDEVESDLSLRMALFALEESDMFSNVSWGKQDMSTLSTSENRR